MITSVYLSNNNVCIVQGTGNEKHASVHKSWHLILKDGSLINGIVTNESELKAQLKRFWKENEIPRRGVYLVLESSRLISRQMAFPKMKRKQILEILPKEFTDIEQQEEMLYDFMMAPDETGQPQVKAVATEREYVEAFLRIFREIGVELAGITVGRNSLLQVLTSMKSIREKSVVFQVLDGDVMTSILCADGIAKYSTQRKIFAEKGSGQFINEIIRSVNRLQQFQMTQRKDSPITEVFLAGVSQETSEACQRSIDEMNGEISIEPISLEKNIAFPQMPVDVGGYLFAIGGLMTNKKGINLAGAARKKTKEKKDNAGVWRKARLLMILTVGLALISASLRFSNQQKQSELAELKDFLEKPENLNSMELADRLDEESAELKEKIAAVEGMNVALASYPKFNQKLSDELEKCAGEEVEFDIVSYDGNRGILTLDARAETVTSIRGFIDRMQVLDLLAEIDYSGYEYNSDSDSYSIYVEGILAGCAGEEEAE